MYLSLVPSGLCFSSGYLERPFKVKRLHKIWLRTMTMLRNLFEVDLGPDGHQVAFWLYAKKEWADGID